VRGYSSKWAEMGNQATERTRADEMEKWAREEQQFKIDATNNAIELQEECGKQMIRADKSELELAKHKKALELACECIRLHDYMSEEERFGESDYFLKKAEGK